MHILGSERHFISAHICTAKGGLICTQRSKTARAITGWAVIRNAPIECIQGSATVAGSIQPNRIRQAVDHWRFVIEHRNIESAHIGVTFVISCRISQSSRSDRECAP